MREGSGTCLQDNRAVGNSRLVPRDGLNVSWKQVPDHSPGTAHFAGMARSYNFWISRARLALTGGRLQIEPEAVAGFFVDGLQTGFVQGCFFVAGQKDLDRGALGHFECFTGHVLC